MTTPPIVSRAAAGALALFLLSSATGVGQTATTNPVGYLQVPCLSNSDTLVAIPFSRPAAFTGAATVSSTSPNTLTFSSAPGFTASQFVYNPAATPAVTDHFYLTIGPANAALTGTLSITQNSATVTGNGTAFGSQGQVLVGDRLAINDGVNVVNFTVTAIASSTSLTLDRPFVDSAVGGSTIDAKPAPIVLPRHNGAPSLAVASKIVQPRGNGGSATLTGLSATFDHSPYEGRWYLVTANDASTVTVGLNGDNLSAVAPGTQVSVIPYWTLNSLLPASGSGTAFTSSPSSAALHTEVLIPDYTAQGTVISPAALYYYVNGTFHGAPNVGWRSFNDSDTADHGNDYLVPDGYFTLHQADGDPNLIVTFSGAVPVNKQATMLTTSQQSQQDNAVGLTRPAGAPISALGLNPGDGSFVSSPSSAALADELLVYDNTTAVTTRSPTAIYYYVNGTFQGNPNVGWRSFNDSDTADHGGDVIPAASALTIRKAATSTGQSVVWTNSPNY